ncbi:MAG: prolyl-tRNA synthetase associated domain-containing protein [Methylobacteriaceae bacterium]|nr:prolyl-tRNA synthetase associated domain-containing protein [Methylobacteriaceae bacterium]
MPLGKDELLRFLDGLGIVYRLHEHAPVFTADEALAVVGHIPGVHCKNLFLKDKAGALWLVTLPDEKRADLKSLPDKIGSKRLSFGNADLLMEALGVAPGSVTVLALINDEARRVHLVLDRQMMQEELINLHPLINTATITLRTADLLRYLDALGRQVLLAEL